jgi:catalase
VGNNIPVFFIQDAMKFPDLIHAVKPEPDRGIPRSLRMMQGFGVHTYRLINAQGESHFVKFHWKPKLGTHSLVWYGAAKNSGADSDFYRRDLSGGLPTPLTVDAGVLPL